jgi:peptide/nickel transport system substrate-binding protein
MASDDRTRAASVNPPGSDQRFTRRGFLRTVSGVLVVASASTSLLAACGPSTPAAPATTAPVATSAPPAVAATSAPAAAPTIAPAAKPTTAAAAPTAAPAAKPTTAPAPAAAGTPGGKLSVAMFLEPASLDPAQQVWVPGIVILKNIIETLVDLDDKGQAKGRLATSWEVSPDGTVWTWHLREGISFQDGTPFNAEAVKFNFDRIIDPATKSQTGVALIGPYKSSEVLDPKTVRMTFSQPYAPLLANLSGVVLGIVSPTAVKKLGQDFGNAPVGTGPYTLTEWVRGDHATVTRWDKYVNTSELTQHKGAPYLDSIVIRFMPEDQTRLAALKNGEIDYMFNVPALDVGGLKSDSKYQTFENMFTGDPTMFLINRQLTPTDDLAVAQALQFAVNKEVISKIATSNTSPIASGPLKPTNWGYNTEVEKLYKFDPEQAKQALDKAGWTPGSGGLRTKDGKEGKLVINVKDDKLTVSMLEAIQGMLRGVGLDLEIRTMSLAASEDLARQGKNNLTFMDWRGTDPDILTVHFHSSNIGGWNMGYFKNDEVDKLLDTARTTVDPQKRLPMYQQAQLLIMQQAATLPLFNQVAVDASKANLQGVRFDATRYYPEWYDASWKA